MQGAESSEHCNKNELIPALLQKGKSVCQEITIAGFRMWNSAYASINRGPAHANLKRALAACPHCARSGHLLMTEGIVHDL
jgi:hypothetical protein